MVSAVSLTRLQLSGTNSLFLSAILPLSALLNLIENLSLFKNLFFSLIAQICDWCVRVRVCVCACVCVCIHVVCIEFVENV